MCAADTKRIERDTNTVTDQKTVTREAFNDSPDLRTSRVVRAQFWFHSSHAEALLGHLC
ncbi:hypothetical protein COCC4DRAFT_33502, partial [Bipolaris maydis ATCC 48331]